MPADIYGLSDEAIGSITAAMGFLRYVLEHPDDPQYTPKQKVDAAKQLGFLASIVLDRTHPRLSSSTNRQLTMNVEVIRDLVKLLPPTQANALLARVEQKMLEAPAESVGSQAVGAAEGSTQTGR